ncbi:MAG: hypothetical protein KCHDKBKB_00809 [Elusimicrobia bacterium]|nr:hypothetical protein [Elusimicrobiota bacterium]
MNNRKALTFLALIAISLGWSGKALTPLFAQGLGSSAGINLMNDVDARATSLAGALGADKDNVGASAYNPASLATLEANEMSLQYGQGLTDDSFSQVTSGFPLKWGTIGSSLYYYNGGEFDLFDGSQRRNVTAQSDYLLTMAFAKNEGEWDWGLSAKYFRSELIETSQASTLAFDFGLARDLTKNLRLATSLQNIGHGLTYDETTVDLPRIGRVSAAYSPTNSDSSLFLFDVPFHMNEGQFEWRMGFETMLGGLQARVGYQYGLDQLGGFTVGAGLPIGKAMIDYNFSLIQHLDNAQRVSVTYRFGAPKSEQEKWSLKIYEREAEERINQMLRSKKIQDELEKNQRGHLWR